MVKIDTGTNISNETIEDVYMKNKLMMNFEVQFRSRINGSDDILEPMFSDLRPNDNDEITWRMVYLTYGQRTVHQVARRVLSQYTTYEVLDNYEHVAEELSVEISKEFKNQNSPLVVSNVVLGKPTPPAGVQAAIDATEQKVAEIAKVEAEREQDIAKAKAAKAIEAEKGLALIERTNAEAEANRILSSSLTPELLQWEQIQAMKQLGEKGNATFIPYEALGNVGAQNKMFNN